jgi:hypothetical protein
LRLPARLHTNSAPAPTTPTPTQALGKTQLHRVFHNLCASAATREALLRLLLAILRAPLSADELRQAGGDDAMEADAARPLAEGPAIDLGAPPSPARCRRLLLVCRAPPARRPALAAVQGAAVLRHHRFPGDFPATDP